MRARDLPAPVRAVADAADVVVHAGDWISIDLLDALEARAHRLVGVYGNNDGPQLRDRLPEVARVELDGLQLAVVNDPAPPLTRDNPSDRRVAVRCRESDPQWWP